MDLADTGTGGHRSVLANNYRMLMKSSVYLRKAPFLSSGQQHLPIAAMRV